METLIKLIEERFKNLIKKSTVNDPFLPVNDSYKKVFQHLPFHLWLRPHLFRPFQPIITVKKIYSGSNSLNACDPDGIRIRILQSA